MAEKDRPIIGIVATRCTKEDPRFGDRWITYINSCYVQAVSRNGGAPFMIPYSRRSTDGIRMLEFCDGVLFPGGTDINPIFYNEEPSTSLGPMDPEVDEFLAEVMTEAIVKKIPLLTVCKGMQLLNVLLGGSLYQDLTCRKERTGSHEQFIDRSFPHHRVDLVEGTIFSKIFKTQPIYTNSLHHQAIKKLAPSLRVSGRAADGIIEAIEGIDTPFLGVQWHPEDMANRSRTNFMNALFRYFIEVLAGGGQWS